MIPILLAGPDFVRGGTVLDGVAQLRLAFTLFTVGFFDTSAFRFLIAAYDTLEPGRGRGAFCTPICPRTQFKQPLFGIFAMQRAWYSFGLKLPNTISASVSISVKT
jgi:hypothetical protein